MKHLFPPLLALLAMLIAIPVGAATPDWGLLDSNPPEVGLDGDMPPPQPTIPRSAFGKNALAPAVARAKDPATAADAGVTLPIVRLGYVVPVNRTAQADATEKLRALVTDAQRWYRDQMDLHGYGVKTFRVETEADGVTPRVHVVTVTETDAYLRGDPYARTIAAAQNAGLTCWTAGEVWVLVPEIHLQAADGSVAGGGIALGASYGSGDDPGVAMISSDLLAMCRAGMASDDRPYDGQTVAEVGPYPLKQDVTYPWYEGTTFSSVCSSHRGAFTHETSHAFGLAHDFRNDSNFHGNLMGNGLRGFRGAFSPARYPADYTRLTTVAAGALNTSRYFNTAVAPATGRPTVNVTTAGAVAPTGGLCPVSFNAAANPGLAFAWLTLDGNVVGEFPLNGTSAAGRFDVPYYTPGTANNFAVTVFDRLGNRQTASTSVIPDAAYPQAPQPYVRVFPPVPRSGEPVTADATFSTDPRTPSAQLVVQWDLEGNGQFITVGAGQSVTFTPTRPGSRAVRARVTDGAGARTDSTPIILHAHLPILQLAPASGGGTRLTWPSRLGFLYELQRSADLQTWSADHGVSSLVGDGGLLQHDDPVGAPAFQRLQFYRSGN